MCVNHIKIQGCKHYSIVIIIIDGSKKAEIPRSGYFDVATKKFVQNCNLIIY